MKKEKLIKVLKVLKRVIIKGTIGIIILGIVFFIYNTLNIEFCEKKLNDISDTNTLKYNIFVPNAHIGRVQMTNLGGFKYNYTGYIYRNIDGKTTLEDIVDITKGIMPVYTSRLAMGALARGGDSSILNFENRINSLGARELIFIKPNNEKKEIKDDLKRIEKIDDSETIEVAISFNKGYPLDFVEKNGLDENTTFLWVDDKSANIDNFEDNIFLGNKVFGIKLRDENNIKIDKETNLGEKFIRDLKNLGATKYQNENFDGIYRAMAGDDGELKTEDIVINGVSLIGTKKEILKYMSKDFCKYVFLGANY